MLLLSKEKKTPHQEQHQLSSQQDPCNTQNHNSGFLSIHHNDPIEIAESLRRECVEYHAINSQRKFALYDGQQGKAFYFGLGGIKEKLLDEVADQRMKAALTALNAEKNKRWIWSIKKRSDYTWIWQAIIKLNIPLFNKIWHPSAREFCDYVRSLGFENVPDDSGLNKKKNEILSFGDEFPWRFASTVKRDEANRRISIVNHFRELMGSML